MEQGIRLDSTPVSARQDTADRRPGDAGRDAAITKMLTASPPAPDADILVLAQAYYEAYVRNSAMERASVEGQVSHEAWLPFYDAVTALSQRLAAAEPKSIEDLALKSLILAGFEAWNIPTDSDPDEDGPDRQIARQFRDATNGGRFSSLQSISWPWARQRSDSVSDPIFAAIEQTKRLHDAWEAAPEITPEETQAFFAHVNDVLLKTPPTTAAGCAALCRFALEFEQANGWTFDEDQTNNHNFRILDLIARSPMLGNPPSRSSAAVTVIELVSEEAKADEIPMSQDRADPADDSAIVAAMLEGWAALAACEKLDGSALTDEELAANDRAFDRRSDLLSAAEALPATRANLLPKMLALSWIEYVHTWERNRVRADYSIDGRLLLDIHEIVVTAPIKETAGRSAQCPDLAKLARRSFGCSEEARS